MCSTHHDEAFTLSYKNLVIFNNFKIINQYKDKMATRITDHSKSIINHVLSDHNIDKNGPINVNDNVLPDQFILLYKRKH